MSIVKASKFQFVVVKYTTRVVNWTKVHIEIFGEKLRF